MSMLEIKSKKSKRDKKIKEYYPLYEDLCDNNTLQIKFDESKEWYSIKRMEKLNPKVQFHWQLLKNESVKMGVPIKKSFDQNYGEVNVYHISV